MKKIIPLFLLFIIGLLCFLRIKTLSPETPLSLRSLVLVSAKPTIVLKEIANEKNIFTDWVKNYTFKNSSYNYRSCTIGGNYHINTLGWECLALAKDELISEDEIKNIVWKKLPNNKRFDMPNYVYKPAPTDFLINYQWTQVLLSDIVENSYDMVSTNYIDIIIYRLGLTKNIDNFFLVKISDWEYIFPKLKANASELLQQHEINLKKFKNFLKKWFKPYINPKNNQDKKVSKVYDYIINNYTYNHEYLENLNTHYKGMNAIQTMQDKTWVCGGFAWAMVYMLNIQGIEARKINGLACSWETCENHSWVAIKYWNKWKYFDPTFEQWTQETNGKWQAPYLFWKMSQKVANLNHFPWKFKDIDGVKEKDYVYKTDIQTELYVKKNQNKLMNKIMEGGKISSYPELYLLNQMTKKQ